MSEFAAVRLDIWLWAARWYKTRALAKQHIERGLVLVDGQTCKPSRLVRVGSEVELQRSGEAYRCQVLGLSEDRGPAPVASALYQEDETVKAARLAARAERKAGDHPKPQSKPNKKERREISGFLSHFWPSD
jgi:ribosome-associated heat shock protein Hsp15